MSFSLKSFQCSNWTLLKATKKATRKSAYQSARVCLPEKGLNLFSEKQFGNHNDNLECK